MSVGFLIASAGNVEAGAPTFLWAVGMFSGGLLILIVLFMVALIFKYAVPRAWWKAAYEPEPEPSFLRAIPREVLGWTIHVHGATDKNIYLKAVKGLCSVHQLVKEAKLKDGHENVPEWQELLEVLRRERPEIPSEIFGAPLRFDVWLFKGSAAFSQSWGKYGASHDMTLPKLENDEEFLREWQTFVEKAEAMAAFVEELSGYPAKAGD